MTNAQLAVRLAKMANRYDMSAVERYEADAESFYWETGFMAPGKDVPVAMGNQNEQERRAAWDAWVAERNQCQKADFLEAVIALNASCGSCAHATAEDYDDPTLVGCTAPGFYNGKAMEKTARCSRWSAK